MTKFFREHLVTFCGWLVGLGIILGSVGTIKQDVSELKQSQGDYQKVRWQVDTQQKTIDVLQQDGKFRDKDIADLNAKVDVICTKLDGIKAGIEDLKKRGVK